jgi:hypothetical protein
MAIINKTGITNGGTIEAEHVTRAIDALSGVSTDTIIATGSFTGSFNGTLTGTASFATTASYALNAVGSGTEYITLHLSSDRITGVTGGTTYYVGTYVTSSNSDEVGVPVLVDGTIVSASVYLNTSSPLNTEFQLVKLLQGGSPVIDFLSLDPKNVVRDVQITSSSVPVTAGDWLEIIFRPSLTATGNTVLSADILIKKS